MESRSLKELYNQALNGVNTGKSYEQMSNFTGIPVQLLQIEHIRKSRESKDYEEQIQFYAVRLIKKHGSQILLIDNINRLTRFIPFRFRSAVKHLIHNLKKQERKLDALS